MLAMGGLSEPDISSPFHRTMRRGGLPMCRSRLDSDILSTESNRELVAMALSVSDRRFATVLNHGSMGFPTFLIHTAVWLRLNRAASLVGEKLFEPPRT